MSRSAKKYLYAVVPADDFDAEGFTLKGIDRAPLYAVKRDGLAMVVSNLDRKKLRPRRRHLKAHHNAVNALVRSDVDTLPMSFGVLAQSTEELRTFLAANQGTLRQQLKDLRNCVEIGFRVAWKVDNLFQYFVDTHEGLRDARDTYFQDGEREPSRQEKVELGEYFREVLEAKRADYRAAVESHLAAPAEQIHADECREETDVMRLACLVKRDKVDAFDEAVHEAAQEFDDNFLFTYTDPTAPYTFVNVTL
ncbi:MAG: GvpL/GvpF family gas vesicle protein [Longimonas sp.]|uniref:GvpL/GvpF family gas vesicle protein n=1 Tax=Longimonas sp. TaxID=2039626 RepID=UPI00334BD02C